MSSICSGRARRSADRARAASEAQKPGEQDRAKHTEDRELYVMPPAQDGEGGGVPEGLLNDMQEFLAAPRNCVSLCTKLVVALATFLVNVLGMREVEDVAKDDPEYMADAASEAWEQAYEGTIPVCLVRQVRRWAGATASADVTHSSSLLGGPGVGEVGHEDRRRAAIEDVNNMDLNVSGGCRGSA